MLKRRSFLAYFSIGWLTSCFPMILAACDPRQAVAQGKPAVNGQTKPNGDTSTGFTLVGSVADFD
jgi:cytochrome b6-f complex iron-sulfur subunit